MTAQLRIVVSDTGGILKIPSQALRFRPNDASPASGHQSANQAASSSVRNGMAGRRRRAANIGCSENSA